MESVISLGFNTINWRFDTTLFEDGIYALIHQ